MKTLILKGISRLLAITIGKEGTMKRLLANIGVVGVMVALAVASFSVSAQAAETKKWSGCLKGTRILSQTTVYPGDVPGHELVLQVSEERIVTSSDPNFQDARRLVWVYFDQVAGSGSHKVYEINFHKDGEETYGKAQGTQKLMVKEGGAWEMSIEGVWQFTGGTGKFQNIKGGGPFKGKATAEGLTVCWEGELEY